MNSGLVVLVHAELGGDPERVGVSPKARDVAEISEVTRLPIRWAPVEPIPVHELCIELIVISATDEELELLRRRAGVEGECADVFREPGSIVESAAHLLTPQDHLRWIPVAPEVAPGKDREARGIGDGDQRERCVANVRLPPVDE